MIAVRSCAHAMGAACKNTGRRPKVFQLERHGLTVFRIAFTSGILKDHNAAARVLLPKYELAELYVDSVSPQLVTPKKFHVNVV